MNKEKLWTKEFISISVVNFFLMLSMYLLLVTMATYATEEYNASIKHRRVLLQVSLYWVR